MARPFTNELTPRQRAVLEWIKEFIPVHGMPPTIREIGDAFGIKSSSVFHFLTTLERKGYIVRGGGARLLEVKGLEHTPSNFREVPVLGRIAAGIPLEAIEGNDGAIHIDSRLLRGSEGYALQVTGDSMIEAGILDGDYAIIRKQTTAKDGDIVVALIDGEATLKRFYSEGNRFRLEPANSSMKPIIVDTGDFRIQGKVVEVRRIL